LTWHALQQHQDVSSSLSPLLSLQPRHDGPVAKHKHSLPSTHTRIPRYHPYFILSSFILRCLSFAVMRLCATMVINATRIPPTFVLDSPSAPLPDPFQCPSSSYAHLSPCSPAAPEEGGRPWCTMQWADPCLFFFFLTDADALKQSFHA
jgi:hypothetical protein